MTRKKQRKKIILFSVLLPAALFMVIASGRLYQSGQSLYEQVRIFSAVMKQINRDYVEPTSTDALLHQAIKGMVAELDPHTTYYTAEEFHRWNQNYEGYSGIGITFDVIQNKITVMSVIENGPGDQAGLFTGDRIVKIENQSVVGIKEDQVPLRLMGPKGTRVHIHVERRGSRRLLPFTLTREEVHVQSIPYAFMMKPGIGYIRILRFSATTAREMTEQLRQLEKEGLRQLIVDLRGNGGGYLETAVEVVDHFLPPGQKIVYTRGRIESAFREFYSTDRHSHPLIPIVVLMDRASASASEIVAGALQDWDRALIVGETSFGKGLVQSQYQFNDGSALLMTTAKYYTPSGRLIQRPYEDKSSEDYFHEAYNNDRSRQTANPGAPVFHTHLLGRKVCGGGGITPDIFFKAAPDTFPEKIRELIFSPQQLFFTFTEAYLQSGRFVPSRFNEFLRNYQPDARCMNSFWQYVQHKQYPLSESEYIAYQQEIRHLLKQTMAEVLFGEEARYKIQLLRDRRLMEALSYMDEARLLLASGYGYTVGASR